MCPRTQPDRCSFPQIFHFPSFPSHLGIVRACHKPWPCLRIHLWRLWVGERKKIYHKIIRGCDKFLLSTFAPDNSSEVNVVFFLFIAGEAQGGVTRIPNIWTHAQTKKSRVSLTAPSAELREPLGTSAASEKVISHGKTTLIPHGLKKKQTLQCWGRTWPETFNAKYGRSKQYHPLKAWKQLKEHFQNRWKELRENSSYIWHEWYFTLSEASRTVLWAKCFLNLMEQMLVCGSPAHSTYL